jgi:hypothetical protein
VNQANTMTHLDQLRPAVSDSPRTMTGYWRRSLFGLALIVLLGYDLWKNRRR